MPRVPRRRRRLLVAFVLAPPLLLLGAGALAYALTPLPDVRAALPVSDTRILDRHGTLIADLPRGGVRRVTIPASALPGVLRQATIAAEDASFYRNPGVDPFAIARAALLDARLRGAAYGGSTITQQLVRNLLLSPRERQSRSLTRKLHEALLALKLTRHVSKDDVLTLYLNTTGYGNLTYGAEAASEFYFGRSAAALDLAQAALLAGLPRAPSLYDPLRHRPAALRRQRLVLQLMRKHGMITARQERLAAAETLHFVGGQPYGGLAPHWVTYVLGLLAGQLGAARVADGGLTVHTTLDLGIQQAAQDAVTRQMALIGRQHNARDAAVAAIAPASGEILVMVGSANPADRSIDGAYNAALAPRQPGSAIKPFTYIAALDQWSPGSAHTGMTAASLLDDVPTTFYTPGPTPGSRVPYQPMDYDARYLGRVPLREALGSSLNIPAVETLQRVGVARMLAVAHRAGITTMYRTDRYGPALTLGGGEVTLLDLTSAYGTIAAGGMRQAPVAILDVTDAAGRHLGDWSSPPATQAFGPRGPQLAALMSSILSDDGARLPAFGADGPLVLPDRPAAAKTGTTTDWRDNWTVGYTPDLVTGVWVGNADNSPMQNISGITGAAPIWHDVMEAALRSVAPHPFVLPPGMVRAPVCRDTGLAPTPSCRDVVSELFIAGTQPGATVSPRRHGDTEGTPRVSGVGLVQGTVASGGNGLAITDPPDGARFALSPDVPASDQKIEVTISGQQAAGGEQLLVDGKAVGACSGQPCTVLWPLRVGRHLLQAQTVGPDRGTLRGPGVWVTVEGQ